MKITRKEAKKILSFIDLIHLNNDDREAILMDVYSEDNDFEKIDDFENTKYNKGILNYLKQEYKGVVNNYLEDRLFKNFNKKIIVIGEIENLIECRCCFYKTIEKRGNYDICKVCKWEDDGLSDTNKYSSVNRSTLKEARVNFIKSGIVSKKYLKMVIVR